MHLREAATRHAGKCGRLAQLQVTPHGKGALKSHMPCIGHMHVSYAAQSAPLLSGCGCAATTGTRARRLAAEVDTQGRAGEAHVVAQLALQVAPVLIREQAGLIHKANECGRPRRGLRVTSPACEHSGAACLLTACPNVDAMLLILRLRAGHYSDITLVLAHTRQEQTAAPCRLMFAMNITQGLRVLISKKHCKAGLGGVVDAALARGPARGGRLAPVGRLAQHQVERGRAHAAPVLRARRRRRLQQLAHALPCARSKHTSSQPVCRCWWLDNSIFLLTQGCWRHKGAQC